MRKLISGIIVGLIILSGLAGFLNITAGTAKAAGLAKSGVNGVGELPKSGAVSATPRTRGISLPYEDDFENIPVGEYPSANGWQNMYSGYDAYVTDETSVSGSKSFKLMGLSYWVRTDYVHIDTPDVFQYEVSVKVMDTTRGARIGFTVEKGNYNPAYDYVSFANDGKIYFVGEEATELTSYSSNRWYTVKVILDFNTLTADVYVDGVLEGSDLTIKPRSFYDPTFGNIILNSFSLSTHNFDGNGYSTVYFDDVKLTAGFTPSVPSAPQNLQATAGDGQVTLSWDPPTNDGGSSITEYRIYRGTSSGSETYFTSVSGSTTTYIDNSVTNGQTYYYQVSAVNSVGEGAKSNEVSATPTSPTVPSPPQNLQATAENGYIHLSWEVPSNNGGSEITKYKIYRSINEIVENGGSSLTLIAEVNASTTSYGDYNVSYGDVYIYYVTAVNSVGESDYSNMASSTLIPSWISWRTMSYTNNIGKTLTLYDLDISLPESGSTIVVVSPLLGQAYWGENRGGNQQYINFERDSIIAALYRMKEIHPSLGVINMDEYMHYYENHILLKKSVNSLPEMLSLGYETSDLDKLQYCIDIPGYGRYHIWEIYRAILLQKIKLYSPSYTIILGGAYEFPEYPLPFSFLFHNEIYFSDLMYVSEMIGNIYLIQSIIGRIPATGFLVNPYPFAEYYYSVGVLYYKNLKEYFNGINSFRKTAEISGVISGVICGVIEVYPTDLPYINNLLLNHGFTTDFWRVDENSNEDYTIDLQNYDLFVSGWHGNTAYLGTLNGTVTLTNLHPMIITGLSCLVNNPPFQIETMLKGVTLVSDTGLGLVVPLGALYGSNDVAKSFVRNMLTQDTVGWAWLKSLEGEYISPCSLKVRQEFRISGDPSLPINSLHKSGVMNIPKIFGDFDAWINISYQIVDGKLQLTIENMNLPQNVTAKIINYSANPGEPIIPAILLNYNTSEDSTYTVEYSNSDYASYQADINEVYVITPNGTKKIYAPEFSGIYPKNNSLCSKQRFQNITNTQIILFPVHYNTNTGMGYINRTVHVIIHTLPFERRNATISAPTTIGIPKGDYRNITISILGNENLSNAKIIIESSNNNLLFNTSSGYTNYEEIYLGNISSPTFNITNSFRIINLTVHSLNPGKYYLNYTLAYNNFEKIKSQTTIYVSGNYTIDLKILSTNIPDIVYCNQSYYANVTIYNNGTVNLTNVQVILYINDTIANSTIISVIHAGESIQVSLGFSISTEGNYTIRIYITEYSGEINTTDNQYEKEIYAIPSPVPEFSSPTALLLPSMYILILAVVIFRRKKKTRRIEEK